jgi:hypothetical protein
VLDIEETDCLRDKFVCFLCRNAAQPIFGSEVLLTENSLKPCEQVDALHARHVSEQPFEDSLDWIFHWSILIQIDLYLPCIARSCALGGLMVGTKCSVW